MSKIIESVEAHYETLEVPFGRIYHWHQAHVTLECECGEILTFSGTSAITACCRCGAAYGALVNDIHYREEHLRDEEAHPWHFDGQGQADHNYETKLLTLRAPPGATTTLRRGWGTIKRDERRPGRGQDKTMSRLNIRQPGSILISLAHCTAWSGLSF